MTTTLHPQPASGPSGRAWLDSVARAAAGIRSRVMEHTIANNGGYLSQACSSAEILATLYQRTLRLGPSVAPMVPPPFPGVPGAGNAATFTGAGYHGAPDPGTDRFYLSPAHYALILYVALVEAGRMAPEGLAQFNQDGGTVEMIGAEHSPGFAMMGGSLAQTLSQAAGIAMARKRRGDTGRVWVFLSDGEFQEGQTWEAIQAMSHYHLDNIGVYVPVFLSVGTAAVVAYCVVFLVLVAVLVLVAKFVATREPVAEVLERWEHVLFPIVLVTLGVFILVSGLAFEN